MQPARLDGVVMEKTTKHADATPEKRSSVRKRKAALLRRTQNKQRSANRCAPPWAELFKLMDTNADGYADPEELSQADKRALRQHIRSRPLLCSTQRRWFLSLDEIPNPAERLGQLDKNDDGTVSRREMRKGVAALLKSSEIAKPTANL